MELYSDTIIDLEGNVVSGADILVLKEDKTTADIFDAAGSPISSLKSGGRGEFAFSVANGKYYVQTSVNGNVLDLRGPLTFYDPNNDKSKSNSVSAVGFGADPKGIVDSTSAIYAAISYLSPFGGGEIVFDQGTYLVKDLVIDKQGILLVGAASGITYDQDKSGVVFKTAPGAIFALRLKGTRSGVPINAAEGSGIRNIVIDDTAYNGQYTIFIDSGLTIVENVTTLGSDYNVVIADQANANVFKNFSFRKGRYTQFAVTEHQAAYYMHPDVHDISSVSNTIIHMSDGNIRQGLGFGVVIRSLLGASGQNVIVESNKFGGLYVYRPDNATVRNLGFEHWHLENNYEGYVSGSASYSIANNRMLWIGPNQPIAWDSTQQAGYQMVIDSQTRYGGGSDSLDFYKVGFHNAGTAQKSFRIMSGFKHRLDKCSVTNGDTANRCKIDQNAEGVRVIDLIVDNNPVVAEQSLVANFGANMGSRGSYLSSGTSFGAGELGGYYPRVGITGGPIHFLPPVPGDPRRDDPRCFSDFFKNNTFVVPWRTGSATPFTVSNPVNDVIKFDGKVFLQCKCTLTVNTATASSDTFFSGDELPFQCKDIGHLVGNVYVEPVSGGASVLNDSTLLRMTSLASVISVKNVFPPLTVNMVFNVYVLVNYTARQ